MLVNSRRVCESTRLCVQGVAEAPIGEVVPGGREVCNGHTTEQDQHERDSSTSGHDGISIRPCNEVPSAARSAFVGCIRGLGRSPTWWLPGHRPQQPPYQSGDPDAEASQYAINLSESEIGVGCGGVALLP